MQQIFYQQIDVAPVETGIYPIFNYFNFPFLQFSINSRFSRNAIKGQLMDNEYIYIVIDDIKQKFPRHWFQIQMQYKEWNEFEITIKIIDDNNTEIHSQTYDLGFPASDYIDMFLSDKGISTYDC